MPDQSNPILSEGGRAPKANQLELELDRFERYERDTLAADRKEREQRLISRFAMSGLEISFNK